MHRIALVVLLLAGWQWDNPRPQGNTLAAVAAAGTTVHAVGDHGSIALSSDDGAHWTALASPVTSDLASIAAAGELVIAVGDAGTIVRSRGGGPFEQRTSPTSLRLIDVAIAPNLILAVAADGRLVRSRDGGDTFDVLPGIAPPPTPASSPSVVAGHVLAIDAVALGQTVPTSIAIAGGLVLIGSSTGLAISRDAGKTFAPTPDVTLPVGRVIAAAGGPLYAVAGARVIYPSVNICNACTDAAYEVRAVFRSIDGGAHWSERVLDDPARGPTAWTSPQPLAPPATVPAGVEHPIHPVGGPAIAAPTDRTSAAAGPHGELYLADRRSLDGGATFDRMTLDGTLAVTAKGTLVTVGANASIKRSTDRAAQWTTITAATTQEHDNLFAIAVTPSGAAFAAGMTGLLAREATGWQHRTTGGRLSDIIALDADHLVAVGDAGTILVSSDGGKTFAPAASGTTESLNALWGAGSELLAVGGEGTVLRSVDAGATWQPRAKLERNTGVVLWGSALDDLYLLTINGGPLRSTDHGKTWKRIAAGIDGVVTGVWGSSATDVYLVGWGGRIFHTADHGKTWTRRASGTTGNLHHVWGRSADDLYIAGGTDYAGAIFHSTDRGKTWRSEPALTQGPLFTVGGNAHDVYVAGGSGTILRATP